MIVSVVVRSVSTLLPGISEPDKRLSFKEQFTWTTVAVGVFLALGGFRLPGSQYPQQSPFYTYESAVAAKRGTLLELGAAPLVIAHALVLTLIAWRFIDSSDKVLITSAKRSLSFILSVALGGSLVVTGHYGDSVFGGLFGQLVSFVFPVFSTMILSLFDEALAQGYGFSNGVNLFIALSVAEAAVSGAASPASSTSSSGAQAYGALVAPILALFSPNRIQGVFDAVFRSDLPNLINLTGTALALAVVFYFQTYRVEVPIKSLRMRGQSGQYPIRVLDHYFFPLISLIALVASLYFALYTGSLLLIKVGAFFPNVSINLGELLARYTPDGRISGGVGYLLAPPRTIGILAPVSAVFYSAAVLLVVALASVFGVEHSSSSSKEVAKQLKEQQLTIQGFREVSLVAVLDRYIPAAARAGGLILGGAVVLGDLLGALGSGAGVVFSAMVVFRMAEIATKQHANILAMLNEPTN